MNDRTDAEVLRECARDIEVTGPHTGGIVDTLQRVASQLEGDAKRYANSQKLQDIGRGAYECVAEMVAALECDYDRLSELKEERQEYGDDGQPKNESDDYSNWSEHPDSEEFKELLEAAGDCESREDAERRISEDPLSIELSGTWTHGETPTADRAYILLGTGGPATRIVCELSDGEPTRAWLQAQDWGTPWTDYVASGTGDTLLTYCQQFYFGEG